MIQEYLNSIDKFIIIGDRVLVKPREMETHTKREVSYSSPRSYLTFDTR